MMRPTKTDCLDNVTSSPEFMLIGFQVLPWLKPSLFMTFFTTYVITMSSNLLIAATVSAEGQLHSPMYFFLANLSCLEICYTSCIAPTLLGGLLTQALVVSFSGCLIQLFAFGWLTSTECFLISVMAYDRYAAICHPLHYTRLMDRWVCLQLALCSWAFGLMVASIIIFVLCQLQFPHCGKIDHFFCDLIPLTKVACSDAVLVELEVFVFAVIVLSLPFLLVIISYVQIISAILGIPSATGRHKAFSTCSSHLVVVTTYFVILILMYMLPAAGHFLNLNKALSLLYTVGTPVFNPIVYTLRNQDFRRALSKAFTQKVSTKIMKIF